MTEVYLAHLYAMRAHVDALILTAQTELGMAQPKDPERCPKCGVSNESSEDVFSDSVTMDGTWHRGCLKCQHQWVVRGATS